MEKQLTPLGTLIEKIEVKLKTFPDEYDDMSLSQRGLYNAYHNAIIWAAELLPSEQKMVEDAHEQGYLDGNDYNGEAAENYFNQTFKNDSNDVPCKICGETRNQRRGNSCKEITCPDQFKNNNP